MVSQKRQKMRSKYKLLLVDDHPIVREGFAGLVTHEPDLTVCGQAGTAAQALSETAKLEPDVVVVDISLKGTNGIELIKQIKNLYPDVRILALSVHDEALYAERALRAGAKGFVMKQAPITEVMSAIRLVAQGGQYLSKRMQERMLEKLTGGSSSNRAKKGRLDLEQLSDRELEVFDLIGRGLGTREIARQLCLSIKTIETYRAHLKDKLKLRNGLELIRHAVETVNRSEGDGSGPSHSSERSATDSDDSSRLYPNK